MQLRIKEVLAEKRMTQADLAEALGMHVTNLNRIINGVINVNMTRLNEIAQVLEVPTERLIMDSPEAAAPNVRVVPIVGVVQAGQYSEAWEWPGDVEEGRPTVTIPNDPALARYLLRAVETRGPSMNRRYPEGTVLVFTDAIETREQIEVGKRYIIERERSDGLREATVKKLWRDNDGAFWLLPESDDPRFQEPIPLEGAEDDTIRIVGRVRYAVSRE